MTKLVLHNRVEQGGHRIWQRAERRLEAHELSVQLGELGFQAALLLKGKATDNKTATSVPLLVAS